MADPRALTRVGVRDLTVMADIGVETAEIGRRQPLVVPAVVAIASPADGAIAARIDYRTIAGLALALAEQRTALIETFVRRLAERCLALGGTMVEVTFAKPNALPDGLAFSPCMLHRDQPLLGQGA